MTAARPCPPDRTTRLVVIGGGPDGAAIIDLVERLAAAGTCHEVVAVLDDARTTSPGPPIDGPIAAAGEVGADAFVVACTEPAARRAAVASMPAGMVAATLVDPEAILRPPYTLGAGTVIHAQACVNATVGNHVLIGPGAMVGHHSRLGDFVTVHAGASLNGAADIGAGTVIGRRATVLEARRVGPAAEVAARAVVASDVAAGCTVAGVPARSADRR